MEDGTTPGGSTCAETANSTDCLLRLVLAALDQQKTDADEEYNWDPITFAFTATIGIIAALLALLTVYQAIIVSGPGRRKSNRRAIGPWALKTKTEWSWRDLNNLSIATTPVLRTDDVLRAMGIREKRLWRLERRQDLGDYYRKAEESHKAFGQDPSGKYSATWLRLLELVQLHKVTFGTALVETTLADYLPSDLLAVPAYAEVGFLTAVAASVGAHSLIATSEASVHSAYPIIIGNGFQFDFRQHPLLGTVGVLSQYGRHPSCCCSIGDRSDSEQESDSKQDHNTAWRWYVPGICKHSAKAATALMHASGFVSCWPREKGQMLMSRQIIPTDWRPKDLDRFQWFNIMMTLGKAYGEVEWLIGANTWANGIPSIFPVELSRHNPNVLSMLALHHKHWSCSTKISNYVNKQSGRPVLITIPSKVVVTSTTSHRLRAREVRINMITRQLPDDVSSDMVDLILQMVDGDGKVHYDNMDLGELSGLLGYRIKGPLEDMEDPVIHLPVTTALHDCCQDLVLFGYDQFRTWAHSMPPFKRLYFRALVLLQIRVLDEWLRIVYDEPTIGFRAFRLLVTTGILLETEKQNQSNERVKEWPTRGGDFNLTAGVYRNWGDAGASSAAGTQPVLKHLSTIQMIDYFLRAPDEEKEHPHFALTYAIMSNIQSAPYYHGNQTWDGPVIEELRNRLDKLYPANQQKHRTTSECRTESVKVASLQALEGEDKKTSLERPSTRVQKRTVTFNEDETRTEEEVLDDMLVWRATMVAALFWSAPDNSRILTSGLWNQIVPVL
ncbi:hypothetical protein QBC36DRAFT_246864 [Triangularia setosa]|uniref:Uncharacterized protein n=1 Tax=Triangularia setosa TaxID=2587417 RepID=A0AAN7A4A3_9PEZI|nr:hypothetical protein QBC36DRAFT_246864 [Podospora setosa]